VFPVRNEDGRNRPGYGGMSTIEDDPRSAELTLAHEVIAASGARPADNVTIAGAGNIEIVLELNRRGFAHVLCRSADHGPHMAAPPADVLIAPGVKSETDLRAILTRLGRDLRARGALVISCARASSSLSEMRLRRLLVEAGFTAVERIEGRDNLRTLWCARKRAAHLRQAA
jgi:hypothetical protein